MLSMISPDCVSRYLCSGLLFGHMVNILPPIIRYTVLARLPFTYSWFVNNTCGRLRSTRLPIAYVFQYKCNNFYLHGWKRLYMSSIKRNFLTRSDKILQIKVMYQNNQIHQSRIKYSHTLNNLKTESGQYIHAIIANIFSFQENFL